MSRTLAAVAAVRRAQVQVAEWPAELRDAVDALMPDAALDALRDPGDWAIAVQVNRRAWETPMLAAERFALYLILHAERYGGAVPSREALQAPTRRPGDDMTDQPLGDAVRAFIVRRGLKLHRNVKWEAEDYDVPKEGDPPDREPTLSLDDAEAVSSLLPPGPFDHSPPGGLHDLLIDVDLEAYLVPTSTEGHHHLYVPLSVPWEDLVAFLRAAVVIGLVEEGYVNACEARGATSLRLPWVHKGDERATTGAPAPEPSPGGIETPPAF